MNGMSPMDELPWFAPVRETNVTLGLGSAVPLVKGDPQRVALIFSGPSGSNYQATMKSNAGPNDGIAVGGNPYITILLTQREFGPMLSQPWFAYSGSGGQANVYEVVMRDWPRTNADSIDRLITAIGALIRALQGGRSESAKDRPIPPARPDIPGRWNWGQ